MMMTEKVNQLSDIGINLFAGPEKTPFFLRHFEVTGSDDAMPFHGIIGRGLLNKMKAHGLGAREWSSYGHRLFDSSPDPITEEESLLKTLARECSTLSFGQSAYCATSYVWKYVLDTVWRDPEIEIWNIKEGHTSSVWKVSIASDERSESFVLNVARDFDASIELRETSEKMFCIGQGYPDINMAKVYDLSFVKDDQLPFDVVVTRNEWISNSYEIHCRNQQETGASEFILIERFLTDTLKPSNITSVLGRRLSSEETNTLTSDIDIFLTKATTILNEKPSLNINDGDVVWSNERAMVVALS